MLIFEWIVGVLLGAVLLAALARRIGAPYPAFLALGGVALTFVPGVPDIRLDPELALALFLAPVLLDAGYDTSLRDLRANWRPITALVVGAVGVTTAAVAAVAMWLVPGMPLAAAIVLGAIVAPPDAVAATSVLRAVNLPHRLLTILEGESLLNDASAILIYRLAVAAAAAGSFSLSEVAPAFLLGVVGSVIAGPALGWVYARLMRRFVDAPSAIILQFVGAFGVWLVAEKVGLSGVLTIVTFAATVARSAPIDVSARLRVPSYAVWETGVFVLTVLAFVLIGIQIGPILDAMEPAERTRSLVVAGAVMATVIVVRLLWVLAYQQVSHSFEHGPDASGRVSTMRGGILVSWAGMRGILTVAAALALPAGGQGGFPYRDLIVLTAFAVVLGTLVVQGLTLRPLVAWLDLKDDDPVGQEIGRARAAAYGAALGSLKGDPSLRAEMLRREFKTALREAERHPEGRAPEVLPLDRLRARANDAARHRVLALRDSGEIGEDAFQEIEQELDWTELSATPRPSA